MTHRGKSKQVDIYDLLPQDPNPCYGGDYRGGEREKLEEHPHLVVAVHHHPRGVAPDEDFPFWGYWLNDEVIRSTPEAACHVTEAGDSPVTSSPPTAKRGSSRSSKAATARSRKEGT